MSPRLNPILSLLLKQFTCELHIAFFVLSSNLTLYDSGDPSGQPLVQITIDSVGDSSWDDTVSSIQVNGGCQWILYDNSF